MSTPALAGPATARRRSFADLSVNAKILTSVALALGVAVVVGVLGIGALGAVSRGAQGLYRSNVVSVDAVGDLRTAFYAARLDLANQAVSHDDTHTAQYLKAFGDDTAAFDAAMRRYRSSGTAADPAVVRDVQAAWARYLAVAQGKLVPAASRHDVAGWQRIRDAEVAPLTAKLAADFTVMADTEGRDAERAAARAEATYRSSRTRSVALLVVGVVLALGTGLVVARGIVRALLAVQAVCSGLASGDLTLTSGLRSRDEVGQMGAALDTALATLRRTVTTIDASAGTLAAASAQLSGVTTSIASSAEESSTQAQAVAAAAEQVRRGVHTVSAGSEEMGASIREISASANEAVRVAGEAVDVAAATTVTVGKLGDSSAEIGNVVKVITSIAEQTNLLALNATIEAARAGEAGKGFAVVASEVKDLAQETARATEDIGRRVQAIQGDTSGAVLAIEQISAVIARIRDFQTTIASAVEEQTATTSEMNRSVAEAAAGTEAIAANITGVAEATRSTSQGATESQQATDDLARMSSELTALVATFRY